jgi:glucan phosphoethanolaminetransferase (alkaline phosphatase superfamily)
VRRWTATFLKLLWGIYLVLTSIYCLLAFLPYTYFALIKAPAYSWMPWFAHHHRPLYWLVLLAAAVASRAEKKTRADAWLFGTLALGGIYLAARPFMPTLQNNWAAYWWSLIALLPLVITAASDLYQHWPAADNEHKDISLLEYSSGVVVAIAVALIYVAGAAVRNHAEKVPLDFGLGRLEIIGWSLLSHALVAIIVISTLNLIRLVTRHARRPTSLRLALNGMAIALVIGVVLDHFLASALSFEGWAAHLYAVLLAVALTLFLGYLVSDFLLVQRAAVQQTKSAVRLRLLPFAIFLSAIAVAMPTLVGGGDWNGVQQSTFTIFFWIVLSFCVYILRPKRKRYSFATILAVLLLAGFSYKALQATDIFWARALGSTDDDVARAMETYAGQDTSFQLAHHILGNAREMPCGDLCRILRQYTNIRDAEAKTDVTLVDDLVPTTTRRPNIFILVIDSMRPDYVGAYNPKVDFTPNLDALARESIALRNVFTQYAGTTLSEPAIWSGTMLLHAHYMQPFSRVNGLEKLANTDGYQMVVSYDTVLSQILSPSDNLTKLDSDKPLWNRFEACSTLSQLKKTLDARTDRSRPVLFYAQPMNVHLFARNDLPMGDDPDWHVRPGFNDRIAHEVHQVDACLGSFFAYLKARGLFDESVIVVTSDHGDATGEFGRRGHSISIFPEVVRVPLIVHLPASMQQKLLYDDNRLSALTDITPSLYYLLGHRPIRSNPLFGRPLFVESKQELETYRRSELFLASDERAVYGLLADSGRFLYTTYDFPAESFLFDLSQDPNAEHNLLTKPLQEEYAQQIIEHLHSVADFYGYKPGVGSLLAAAH